MSAQDYEWALQQNLLSTVDLFCSRQTDRKPQLYSNCYKRLINLTDFLFMANLTQENPNPPTSPNEEGPTKDPERTGFSL